MSKHQFALASNSRISQRQNEVTEFFGVLFDLEDYPFFVSDEASLQDIFVGNEVDVRNKIKAHYGVNIEAEQLAIPLWKLLDILSIGREQK